MIALQYIAKFYIVTTSFPENVIFHFRRLSFPANEKALHRTPDFPEGSTELFRSMPNPGHGFFRSSASSARSSARIGRSL